MSAPPVPAWMVPLSHAPEALRHRFGWAADLITRLRVQGIAAEDRVLILAEALAHEMALAAGGQEAETLEFVSWHLGSALAGHMTAQASVLAGLPIAGRG